MLFSKLDVLLVNPNHAEAFLEPAQALFFDSNILCTVGSKIALFENNNPLKASTSPVEGMSTLTKAMGAREPVKKAAMGREWGV
jgi:hypothetical protein